MKLLIMFRLKFVLLYLLTGVSCQELYVGCYTDLKELFSYVNTVESSSQCLNQCKMQTFRYAVLKDGSSCYCGNNITTKVPTSNCNLPCKDNNGICGGKDFYAVYTAMPPYIGCYHDNRSRDMIVEVNTGMSIDSCYKICSHLNHSYFAIQNSDTCYCGDQYGRYGKAASTDCDMVCAGGYLCGGVYRNSIYSTNYHHGLNLSYSKIFHCFNEETDVYGVCQTKLCTFGWKGTKCNERDCLLNNGNCGDHKCEESKIGNEIISECVCNEGFQSKSLYDECEEFMGMGILTSTSVSTHAHEKSKFTSKENMTERPSDGSFNSTHVLIIFIVIKICAVIISIAGLLYCQRKRKFPPSQMEMQTEIENSVYDKLNSEKIYPDLSVL